MLRTPAGAKNTVNSRAASESLRIDETLDPVVLDLRLDPRFPIFVEAIAPHAFSRTPEEPSARRSPFGSAFHASVSSEVEDYADAARQRVEVQPQVFAVSFDRYVAPAEEAVDAFGAEGNALVQPRLDAETGLETG